MKFRKCLYIVCDKANTDIYYLLLIHFHISGQDKVIGYVARLQETPYLDQNLNVLKFMYITIAKNPECMPNYFEILHC